MRTLKLVKLLKDAREILLINADPGIGDGKLDSILLPKVSHPDLDLTLWGKLKSVPDQVLQDLLKL